MPKSKKNWAVGKNDGSMRQRWFATHDEAAEWIGKQQGAVEGKFYLDPRTQKLANQFANGEKV